MGVSPDGEQIVEKIIEKTEYQSSGITDEHLKAAAAKAAEEERALAKLLEQQKMQIIRSAVRHNNCASI